MRGLAIDLGEERIGCVLLGDTSGIASGSIVRGTGEVARAPVGEALARPRGRRAWIAARWRRAPKTSFFSPVEQPAPAIVDRALVTRPLATGLLVIDAMIPLGRGSANSSSATAEPAKRQSPPTRSSINAQATSSASTPPSARRSSSVVQVIEAVRRYGAPERCLFVVGEADARAWSSMADALCRLRHGRIFHGEGARRSARS